MLPDRVTRIAESRRALAALPFVHAACLEGADASGTADAYQTGRTIAFKRQEGLTGLHERRDLGNVADCASSYSIYSGNEATISQAVGRVELRRARYVGQAKVRLQAIGTAVAVNLTRLDDWLEERRRATTRTGRFAAFPFPLKLDQSVRRCAH